LLIADIELQEPNAVILGGMAYTDLEYLRKGEMKYMNKAKIEPV
jgi:hypothetical protein